MPPKQKSRAAPRGKGAGKGKTGRGNANPPVSASDLSMAYSCASCYGSVQNVSFVSEPLANVTTAYNSTGDPADGLTPIRQFCKNLQDRAAAFGVGEHGTITIIRSLRITISNKDSYFLPANSIGTAEPAFRISNGGKMASLSFSPEALLIRACKARFMEVVNSNEPSNSWRREGIPMRFLDSCPETDLFILEDTTRDTDAHDVESSALRLSFSAQVVFPLSEKIRDLKPVLLGLVPEGSRRENFIALLEASPDFPGKAAALAALRRGDGNFPRRIATAAPALAPATPGTPVRPNRLFQAHELI